MSRHSSSEGDRTDGGDYDNNDVNDEKNDNLNDHELNSEDSEGTASSTSKRQQPMRPTRWGFAGNEMERRSVFFYENILRPVPVPRLIGRERDAMYRECYK